MEVKLVNIANPKIYIVVPKNYIKDVVGNCYQVNSSQPLTFAKSLWKLSNDISQQSGDRITLFKIATILSQYEDKDGSPLEQIRDIVRNATIDSMNTKSWLNLQTLWKATMYFATARCVLRIQNSLRTITIIFQKVTQD